MRGQCCAEGSNASESCLNARGHFNNGGDGKLAVAFWVHQRDGELGELVLAWRSRRESVESEVEPERHWQQQRASEVPRFNSRRRSSKSSLNVTSCHV